MKNINSRSLLVNFSFVIAFLVLNIDYIIGADDVRSTYQTQISAIRKNRFIVINNRPCKVMEISKRNGEARIVGSDIFAERQYEATFLKDSVVDVPNVTRQEYTLIDITNDDIMVLMAENTDTREDLYVPEGELGNEIREELRKASGQLLVTVIVMSALGEEGVVAVKTDI